MSQGLWDATGEALRVDAMATESSASFCPANMVEVSETSVVEAIDDADAAGDGVRGSVSNGGSCCR